jgi:hypothetical protein
MARFSLNDSNFVRSFSSTLVGVVCGYDPNIKMSLQGDMAVIDISDDIVDDIRAEVIDFMLSNGFEELI